MKNIYVADALNNRIQVFDSAGSFLFEFGSSGSGDGQFKVPFGIAVDSRKNIYVADLGNLRIQVFSEPIITTPIPTLSEWSLIALAGILGIVGFIMVIRRRKLTV